MKVRLQEVGFAIRRARQARQLTQADLAAAAGISRTTLNQIEAGVAPDLGVRKILTLLDKVGLTMAIRPATKERRPDFVRMACTTANVSFNTSLSEDELIKTLLTGKIPAGKQPHLRAIFDEANPALLKGLQEEISQWTKPGKVENNLAKIADRISATRNPRTWMTSHG
jgi:transcriptional regulator with XRE-family HTH domain